MYPLTSKAVFTSKDIKTYTHINKVLSYFCVVPKNTQSEKKLSLENVFIIASIIISSLGSGYTIYMEPGLNRDLRNYDGISDIFEDVNDMLIINVCFITTLIKKKHWKTFNSWINCVDDNFDNGHIILGKSYYLSILFFTISPCASLIMDIAYIVESRGEIPITTIYSSIAKYYSFALSFLICNSASILARRYGALTNISIFHINKTLNGSSNSDTEGLTKIRKIYSKLNDGLKEFNDLFGWPMLFIFSEMLGDLITFINFAIAPTSDVVISSGTIVRDTLKASISMIRLVVLIMSCDSIESKAQEFINSNYLLQSNMDKSFLRDELFYLVKWAKELAPKCSAAGLFTVNQGIFVKVFSALVTYIIVFIQFNTY